MWGTLDEGLVTLTPIGGMGSGGILDVIDAVLDVIDAVLDVVYKIYQ